MVRVRVHGDGSVLPRFAEALFARMEPDQREEYLSRMAVEGDGRAEGDRRADRDSRCIDWDDPKIARPNADGVTVLPAEWYCPEDDGLYDDLV